MVGARCVVRWYGAMCRLFGAEDTVVFSDTSCGFGCLYVRYGTYGDDYDAMTWFPPLPACRMMCRCRLLVWSTCMHYSELWASDHQLPRQYYNDEACLGYLVGTFGLCCSSSSGIPATSAVDTSNNDEKSRRSGGPYR